MKKKIIALLLSIIMLFGMLPTSVFAANYDGVTEPQVTFIFTPKTMTVNSGSDVEYSLSVYWNNVSITGLGFAVKLPDGMTYVPKSGKISSEAMSVLGFQLLDWTDEGMYIDGAAANSLKVMDEPVEIATFSVSIDEGAEVGDYEIQADENRLEIVDGDFEYIPNELIEVKNEMALTVTDSYSATFVLQTDKSVVEPGEEITYSLYFNWTGETYGFLIDFEFDDNLVYVEESGEIDANAQSALTFNLLNWTEDTRIVNGITPTPYTKENTEPILVATFKVQVPEDTPEGNYSIKINPNNLEVVTTGFVSMENEVVEIINPEISVEITEVTALNLDINNASLSLANPQLRLTAIISPEDATNKKIVWSSSDDSVATVDSYGLVTRVGEGTALIRATSAENADVFDTCEISIAHECEKKLLTLTSEEEPAKCYSEGKKAYYTCTCGKIYLDEDAQNEVTEDDLIIAPLNHPSSSVVKTERVEPTHVLDGNIAYWTCTLCGNVFSDESCQTKIDDVSIPATGHENATELPWTASEGTHQKICSCGEILSEEAHAFVWVTDEGSTCVQAGTKHEECTVCAFRRYDGTEIEKLSHNPQKTEAVEPTCNEDGNIEYYTCSECLNTFADEACTQPIEISKTVLESLGHRYNVFTIKPTCTEEGYTKYECTRCDEVYTDSVVVALGHTEGEWKITTAPTCTFAGEKTQYCEVCKAAMATAEEPATGHTPGEWETVEGANCEIGGERVIKCTVCFEILQTEEIPATGHTEGEWKITTDATCTEDGEETLFCLVCNAPLETRAVEKTGHSYGEFEETIAPTCTLVGEKIKTCSECGDEVKEEIPALGHSAGEWVTVTNATCTSDGEKAVKCIICSETLQTEVIPATGHTEGEWITTTEPTFDEKGEEKQYCTVCNAELDSRSIEPIGHELGEWITVVEATCTQEGVRYRQCLTCKDITVETIPVLEHTASDWQTKKEETCKTTGIAVKSCTSCGKVLEEKELPVLEHTAGIWVIKQNATCESSGVQTKSCTVCGELLAEEEIPALGHTEGEWVTVTKATCTTFGEETLSCTSCHKVLDRKLTQSTEHTRGEWIVVTAASCTEEGNEYISCTECGYVIAERNIAPSGHVHQIVRATAPTCTQSGLTEGEICSLCGEIFVPQEEIPALGHTLGEWETETEPTMNETGLMVRKCVSCSEVIETEIIPAKGAEFSGTIESFDDKIDNSDEITIELFKEGEDTAKYSATVEGSGAQFFSISDIETGTYTVKVSKANHTTRTYTVEISGNTVAALKIHLVGDITGDGKVNLVDMAKINAYLSGESELEGYELECADVNLDGKTGLQDLASANGYVSGLTQIWK